MMNIFIFLIFTSFEFPYFASPKETLFIGEPILIQPKFKNNENSSKKIIFNKYYSFPHREVYFIHNKDTFFFDLNFFGIDITVAPSPLDTFIIQPGDSLYGYFTCFFPQDFMTKNNIPFLFPYEDTIINIKIYITSFYVFPNTFLKKLDSINLFFKKAPENEKEIVSFLTSSVRHPTILENKKDILTKIKNLILKCKNSYFLPYLYLFYYMYQYLNSDKIYEGFNEKEIREPTDEIKKIIENRLQKERYRIEKERLEVVQEMKKRFPNHFLTQELEIRFIMFDGPRYVLKNKERIKWEKEISKKYSSYYLFKLKKMEE